MRLTPAFIDKLIYLAILSVVATVPYAVPALGDFVMMKLGFTRSTYLLKPVENQRYYVQFAICGIAILAIILRLYVPSGRLRRNSILYLATAFMAIAIISAFGSRSVEFTLRGLLMPVSFFIAFLLIQSLRFSVRALQKLLFLAAVVSIPACIYAIAQSQGYEFLPYSKYASEATMEEVAGKQLISSTFGHPNYLASYVAPLSFFGLLFALLRGSSVRRALGGAMFFLSITAMVLGGTRGGWLALIGGGIPMYLLLAISPLYRRQLLFAGGLAIVIAFGLVLSPIPFLQVQFDFTDRLLASKEISSRFYYWLIALEMFKQNLLLGVGFENYNSFFWETVDAFQRKPDSGFYRFVLEEHIRGISPQYVHNDWLQVATESGLVAILIWFALWSALLCQAWETARLVRRNASMLLTSAAFVAFFAAYALDGMVNFPLHIPVSGFIFWVGLGAWLVFRSQARRQFAPKITEGISEATHDLRQTSSPKKAGVPVPSSALI